MTDHFHHVWLLSDIDKVASATISIFENTLKVNFLCRHHHIFEVEMGTSVGFCHGVVGVAGLMGLQ